MFDRADLIERQFRDAEKRARRHQFADGLAEIVVGGAFVSVGLYFGTQAALVRGGVTGRVPNILVNLLFLVVVTVAFVVGRRALRSARERLVYPRAGYVRHVPSTQPRWVPGLVGAAVAALTMMLVRRAPSVEAWIPALEGFIVGAALLGLGRLAGLPRLSVPGLVVMLAGVAVSLLRESSDLASALLFAAIGSILLVSGALALRRFLGDASSPEVS
jgi:hypothetical protein